MSNGNLVLNKTQDRNSPAFWGYWRTPRIWILYMYPPYMTLNTLNFTAHNCEFLEKNYTRNFIIFHLGKKIYFFPDSSGARIDLVNFDLNFKI